MHAEYGDMIKGRYAEIAQVLRSWYGGLATRINFPLPADPANDARPWSGARAGAGRHNDRHND